MADDTTPTDAENQAAGKTFTQDEVNKFVGERSQRLKEAYDRGLPDIRAEAGESAVAAYRKDQAKTTKKDKQATDSERTEFEGSIARLTKERDEFRESADRHLSSIKRIRVDEVLLKSAHKMRFIDPNDSIRYVSSRVKYDPVKDTIFVLDEKGKPSGETVDELLTSLATEKEYLIQPTGQSGSGSRGAASSNGAGDGDGMDKTSSQWISSTLRKGLFGQ